MEHSKYSLSLQFFRTSDDWEEEIKGEEDVDEGDDMRDSKEKSTLFGRKFLVFKNCLLQLFQHCSTCLAPRVPQVQKVTGTMVVIEAKCSKMVTKAFGKVNLVMVHCHGETCCVRLEPYLLETILHEFSVSSSTLECPIFHQEHTTIYRNCISSLL